MDERKIIEEAKEGNPKALEKLVMNWQARIYYFALRYLGNEEDAKDVTQEVFFSVFRNLHQLRNSEAFPSWIYKITLNCIRQHVRRFPKQLQLNQEIVGESEPKGEGLVEKALAYLSPQHREVILLKEVEGFSIKEIAEMLGVPEGTVKSRLFYGLKSLREIYLKLREGRYEELQ